MTTLLILAMHKNALSFFMHVRFMPKVFIISFIFAMLVFFPFEFIVVTLLDHFVHELEEVKIIIF